MTLVCIMTMLVWIMRDACLDNDDACLDKIRDACLDNDDACLEHLFA